MAKAAFDYDGLKLAIKDDDPKVRVAVADDPAIPGEILYFLAEDGAAEVRRAVAGNPSAPNQADMLLSRDADYAVRCAVARKVVGAGLGDAERSGLWRMGFTILETLACDQMVRVRRILTEAFKSEPDAPVEIVKRLARDNEREVAAPVLRNSPLLDEDDIIDIVRNNNSEWVHEAVAGRETVPAAVSEVLARSDSLPAVSTMIANDGAAIAEPVMQGIVGRAEEAPELHAPLVNRNSLSAELMVKLARFVAAPLLAVLQNRDGLDQATIAELGQVARDRGAAPKAEGRRKGLFRRRADGQKSAPAEDSDGDKAPPECAPGVGVVEDLAARTGYPVAVVQRMVQSGSARSITALCWKAGVTMRFAVDVQRRIGKIPPQSLLYARAGVDFPLSEHEMTEQLALFNV